MTGLRIRWRREPGTSQAVAISQPSDLTLGRFVWLTVALIVALAFTARIYNVNWDETTHLHPDERGLTMVATNVKLPSSPGEYLSQESSPLNPYNAGSNSYVYGNLPLTLTKVAAVVADREDYDRVVLVGRFLSALFSAATVGLVFLCGRRVFGSTAGLLGAFLMATAPLAIQHAHFFVVDSYVTFFTTAVLYFALRAQQEGHTRDFALAGLMVGLGMACKLTAIVISPIVGVAAIAYAWPALRRAWQEHTEGQRGPALFESMRRPLGGVVLA